MSEKQLTIALERIAILETEAKNVSEFYPDPAHINALPQRLKDWVMNLETEADPAGTIQRAYAAELDRNEARLAVAKFKAERDELRQKVEDTEFKLKRLRNIFIPDWYDQWVDNLDATAESRATREASSDG